MTAAISDIAIRLLASPLTLLKRVLKAGLPAYFACLVAAIFMVTWTSAQAASAPIPALTSRVTDTTQTLDAATRASLTAKLADLEQRKGAQIAVLMVPTTGDDTIEQYAVRAFEQWKLGRQQVDDGILFVIAKNDKRLRIEVGYGLEGAVPDLLAGRIIREQVTPLFKQGDFSGGVVAGVDSLIRLVNNEDLPPPKTSATPDTSADESVFGMLVPLAFMALVLPASVAGLVVAAFIYLMSQSLGYALLGGFVAFLLSLIGRSLGAGGRSSSARASRRGGVLGGVGGGLLGGGSGRGGGGFGGGGFGGGGGGSGGGGASGGW